MKINDFRRIFKLVNGFYLTDTVMMFRKPLEIWDEVTNESVKFKKLDDALAYKVDGRPVIDIIGSLNSLYLEPAK